MRRVKSLLAIALVIGAAAACSGPPSNSGATRASGAEDDRYSDSNAFRYYAGPGADIVNPDQLKR